MYFPVFLRVQNLFGPWLSCLMINGLDICDFLKRKFVDEGYFGSKPWHARLASSLLCAPENQLDQF